MKWKHHQIGDKWEKVKFAWLPTEADDGYTYWFTSLRYFYERRRSDLTFSVYVTCYKILPLKGKDENQ